MASVKALRLSGGSITYTPDLGYYGNDSFSFQVTDNHNQTSNIAKVLISIEPSQIIGQSTQTTAHNMTYSDGYSAGFSKGKSDYNTPDSHYNDTTGGSVSYKQGYSAGYSAGWTRGASIRSLALYGDNFSSNNMTSSQDNTTTATPSIPSQNQAGGNVAPSEAPRSLQSSGGIDWMGVCTTLQPA